MKPVIGIFPSYEGGNDTLSINRNYVNAIISCDGIPYILPLCEDLSSVEDYLEHIDGLLLSGGVDISPEYYNEKNTGSSRDICPLLDKNEKVIIEKAIEKDIPILGICRGMQALNVFCGGSLVQDIKTCIAAAEIHSSDSKPVFHNIQISKSSPLSDIIGFGTHRINSYHHQAVKKLAPDFSIAAASPDGVIEAIFRPESKFVLGIQWHPERDNDTVPDNIKIIKAFVNICTCNERRSV